MTGTTRRRKPPPPGPAFFLSYARAKPSTPRDSGSLTDANRSAKQLFSDLTDRVRQLLPLPTGAEIGFMDHRIEAGEIWTEALLTNLGRSRVFVALLSPPYLERSEWCPMEWDLFGRRAVRVRPGATAPPYAKAIIPVRWTPVTEIPPMVKEVQFFTPPAVVLPRHVAMYESEGVLGMLDLDEAAYKAVVWTLARRIQETYTALQVTPDENPSTVGLRTSFADGAR